MFEQFDTSFDLLLILKKSIDLLKKQVFADIFVREN